MEDKVKKARSPQFPFISLERAVLRAKEFEAEYHQHEARASNAVKVWKYAPKSSGGIQTIAALTAYGLMKDEGSLQERKLKLTPMALTILKDTRGTVAAEALKHAALRPRVILELWKTWGVQRPPNRECISTLHLDRHFTEEAAARFLQIYDATIRYAGLAPEDKLADTLELEADAEATDELPQEDKREEPPVVTGSRIPPNKVTLMENERVVFAHELRPNQSFRIVVADEVNAEMVEAWKAFADFQGKLVSRHKPVTDE